jgi:hypothetical protein
MTYLEAAFQVLNSSRTPLTTREITERALREGLISTHGKTPTASMSATLYLALCMPGVVAIRVHPRESAELGLINIGVPEESK